MYLFLLFDINNLQFSLISSAIPSSTMLKISTTSSLSLPPRFPPLHFNEASQLTATATIPTSRITRWTPQTKLMKVSSSESSYQTVVDVAPTSETSEGGAADVVRRFYEGINGRDLVSVEELIADNCVYEDLVFPQPFVGRKAILDFFKKFSDSISSDLQFVIDDISTEDSSAVGVTWHLGTVKCNIILISIPNNGKESNFPSAKDAAFIGWRYGRDIVEPAIKPGESALGIIRAVTWLLQQFPQLADRL
ncbi:hypothetical protein Pint_07539 [Pistacia integerrima]|uniref:Uncharacterized protein n=1 Tax=Pistacia integerrima TaxID=434235 RepID=A0ACC0XZE6_9ROSI|nr:hypothetical protein Pint_07539 [Pistacia integerrima]